MGRKEIENQKENSKNKKTDCQEMKKNEQQLKRETMTYTKRSCAQHSYI